MNKVHRMQTEARGLGVYSNGIWNRKCIEPIKRVHGDGLQWICHRFEIKNGISWRDAMIRDFSRPNPLLEMAVVRLS